MRESPSNTRPGGAFEEVNVGADYSDDEREFLVAMERYKRVNRRPFPTWREVLQVALALGYRKG